MLDLLDDLPSDELAAIISRGSVILAARAAGQQPAAAPPVPVQIGLIPADDPIDPACVNLRERLADGSDRFVQLKEAAALFRCSVEKMRNLAKHSNAGFQVGGTWWIDRTRLIRFT